MIKLTMHSALQKNGVLDRKDSNNGVLDPCETENS